MTHDTERFLSHALAQRYRRPTHTILWPAVLLSSLSIAYLVALLVFSTGYRYDCGKDTETELYEECLEALDINIDITR